MADDFRRTGPIAGSRALSLRLTAGLVAAVLVAGAAVPIAVAADGGPADDPFAVTDPALAPAPKSPATTPPADAKPKSAKKSSSERKERISLNFKAASWSKVLRRVAKHSGLTLVMKRAPAGSFSRNDLNLYTIAEVIWILNRDLEASGYRLVRQGDFLMVLDIDGLRSDYRPSFAHRFRRDDDPDSPTGVRPASAQQPAGAGSGGAPALLETVAPETAQEKTPTEADNTEDEIAKKQIRLLYISTPWSQVLPRVAEQSGLILVMKRCPSGTFQHPVFSKVSVVEAITIINKELEDTNFRLVRQDKFLIVLYTEDLRTEYERPVVGAHRHRVHQQDEPILPSGNVRQASAEEISGGQAGGVTNASAAGALDPSVRIPAGLDAPRRTPDLESGPLLLENEAPSPSPAASQSSALPQKLQPSDESTAAVESAVFVPQHGTASAVAQQMYQALRQRSELLTPGIQGLPSFRVRELPQTNKRPGRGDKGDKTAEPPTSFAVGFDAAHNRLVIEATPKRLSAVLRLCDRLDAHADGSGLPLELVSADAETCALAKTLAPELDRLIAQRGPQDSPANNGANQGGMNGNGGNQNAPGAQPGPAGQRGISDIIKGLKGDVTVESVPDLGILILRGGQSDVEAVMKVIREIERLSAVATPQIHILQLQFVNSESFSKLLNEVYKALSATRAAEGAGRSSIQIFPIVKPNAVLVLAPEADMPSVLKLAQQLDLPVNPELEFQVYRLRYGYAAAVARSVSEFYKSPRALGTSVNVFADARTNSIIVQARPRDLTEVGRLIEKLDGPTASQATIKIFPLQNADATSIQRLLETLFGTGQTQRAGQGQTQQQQPGGEEGGETQAPTLLRLSVDVRTNSIIALGPPDTLRAVEAVITRLDNSDIHQRETTVIRLKNNASDNVARAITDFVRSQRELQQIDPEALSNIEVLEREVFVVSEPVSNTLLLSATPRYFAQLKQMIEKLDAPPAQVIIQALLVEVELDNTDEFGIELGFQSPVLFQRSNISNLQTLQTTSVQNPTTTVANNVLLSSTASPGFQFGDPSSGLGTNPANGAAQVGTQELTNLGVGRTDPTLNMGGLVLAASSESVSALLRALSYKKTVHVLSRPQIRTLDNRLASIQVGQRVPVVYSASVNAITGTIQPIIQYDNAGIILTVQPRITPDGMIALEAYAEKSQYETTGVTLLSSVGGPSVTSPIKDITRAEASVNVASGNTVVMGGMITSSDTLTTSKVPWFGDIPVVGQLFRYDNKSTKRTELLIFLTPRVIRDDADDELIKQVETERIHFLVDEAEAIHGPILSNRPPALQECPLEGVPLSPLLAPTSPLSHPAEMAPAPSTPGAPAPSPSTSGASLPIPPSPQGQPGTTQPPVPLPPPANQELPAAPSGGPAGSPAPAGPALPLPGPAPGSQQRNPVLPPPQMPPVGSRPSYQLLVPLSGTPGTFNGGTQNGPQPCAPANSRAPVTLQPTDQAGVVRPVSFDNPWENEK